MVVDSGICSNTNSNEDKARFGKCVQVGAQSSRYCGRYVSTLFEIFILVFHKKTWPLCENMVDVW